MGTESISSNRTQIPVLNPVLDVIGQKNPSDELLSRIHQLPEIARKEMFQQLFPEMEKSSVKRAVREFFSEIENNRGAVTPLLNELVEQVDTASERTQAILYAKGRQLARDASTACAKLLDEKLTVLLSNNQELAEMDYAAATLSLSDFSEDLIQKWEKDYPIKASVVQTAQTGNSTLFYLGAFGAVAVTAAFVAYKVWFSTQNSPGGNGGEIVCKEGSKLQGDQCIAIVCEDGFQLKGNDCIPHGGGKIACEDGFQLQGDKCIALPKPEDNTGGTTPEEANVNPPSTGGVQPNINNNNGSSATDQGQDNTKGILLCQNDDNSRNASSTPEIKLPKIDVNSLKVNVQPVPPPEVTTAAQTTQPAASAPAASITGTTTASTTGNATSTAAGTLSDAARQAASTTAATTTASATGKPATTAAGTGGSAATGKKASTTAATTTASATGKPATPTAGTGGSAATGKKASTTAATTTASATGKPATPTAGTGGSAATGSTTSTAAGTTNPAPPGTSAAPGGAPNTVNQAAGSLEVSGVQKSVTWITDSISQSISDYPGVWDFGKFVGGGIVAFAAIKWAGTRAIQGARGQ